MHPSIHLSFSHRFGKKQIKLILIIIRGWSRIVAVFCPFRRYNYRCVCRLHPRCCCWAWLASGPVCFSPFPIAAAHVWLPMVRLFLSTSIIIIRTPVVGSQQRGITSCFIYLFPFHTQPLDRLAAVTGSIRFKVNADKWLSQPTQFTLPFLGFSELCRQAKVINYIKSINCVLTDLIHLKRPAWILGASNDAKFHFNVFLILYYHIYCLVYF